MRVIGTGPVVEDTLAGGLRPEIGILVGKQIE